MLSFPNAKFYLWNLENTELSLQLNQTAIKNSKRFEILLKQNLKNKIERKEEVKRNNPPSQNIPRPDSNSVFTLCSRLCATWGIAKNAMDLQEE